MKLTQEQLHEYCDKLNQRLEQFKASVEDEALVLRNKTGEKRLVIEDLGFPLNNEGSDSVGHTRDIDEFNALPKEVKKIIDEVFQH